MHKLKHYIPLISLFCLLFLQQCQINNGTQNQPFAYDSKSSGMITPADDSQLSEQQQKDYRTDAEILAMRYVNAKDSTQVILPSTLVNSLYNGLVHIVTSSQKDVDQFTQVHPVHARNRRAAYEILILANSTAPWLEAWENNKTETGNNKIDNLINRFGFTLTDYDPLPSNLPTILATLHTSEAYNMVPVSHEFEQIDGINNAKPNIDVTDGNDITVLFFDDHLRFTFDYGFGDCPSQCESHYFWKYNIYKDGSVEFIKKEGSNLP